MAVLVKRNWGLEQSENRRQIAAASHFYQQNNPSNVLTYFVSEKQRFIRFLLNVESWLRIRRASFTHSLYFASVDLYVEIKKNYQPSRHTSSLLHFTGWLLPEKKSLEGHDFWFDNFSRFLRSDLNVDCTVMLLQELVVPLGKAFWWRVEGASGGEIS